MTKFSPLEQVIRRAPLGLRFLDLVRGVTVNDGLVVVAAPDQSLWPVMQAQVSPLSGVYGFRNLPGLRPFETGDRPASDWCAPSSPPGAPSAEELLDLNRLRGLVAGDEGAPAPNFVINVQDRLGRFLPQVLELCLPKERLIEVPLFSSPARPAPAGLGIVRGEVWNLKLDLNSAPAGWAVVTATLDGTTTYVAVADARGMFTLFLPYASALPPLVGSPPHGTVAVDQLTWAVTLHVYYQPAQLKFIGDFEPPDTRSILAQGTAQVFDTPSTLTASLVRAIRFGQDLIVRTGDGPRLLVRAA